MTIHCRPMLPKDVRPSVEILAVHPVVAPRYGDSIDQLRPAWLSLLGCEAFRAVVFEEIQEHKTRLVAAGVSVFVTDSFVRELKTPPLFWIGPELAGRIVRGDSPLLTDEEVCAANTHGGLNLVLWHVCIAPKDTTRAEVRTQVSGGFFDMHRGFLLKELIAVQTTFAEEAQWTLDGGGFYLSSEDGSYVDRMEKPAHEILATPHIFGLTRELALHRMSWISSLFHYEAPKIGLSAGERRLLVSALRGGTDAELSDELAISLSAVKKAWHSVYERVAENIPHSIRNDEVRAENSNGERGKQKKQRLLAYLRDHPEELRPYSRKTRTESKVWIRR